MSRFIQHMAILAALLAARPGFAQQGDLEFLVEKIRVEYPGFRDKTDSAGFARLTVQVLAQYPNDTFRAMSLLVNSFRDQHLRIYDVSHSPKPGADSLRRQFQRVNAYLRSSRAKRPYEGYWVNDYANVVVGILEERRHPRLLKAYVVEARDTVLLPGMVMSIHEEAGKESFTSDYRNWYGGTRYFLTTAFRNDSVFTTGAEGKWKKLRNYQSPLLPTIPEFSPNPTGEALDDSTYLVRIPGSSARDKEIIDSLVHSDSLRLFTARTLILDFRNNMGGSSSTFYALLPLLYTKPIIRHYKHIYSTATYIASMQATIAAVDSTDTATIRAWQSVISEMQDSLGRFIFYGPDTIAFDAVLAQPKQVGILMNYACQSASELMILMARQSSKATLFGERTMGAVGYLDNYYLDFPSGRYKLNIATARRVVPEGQHKIDGVGLYPDVPISDQEQDWVEFVRRYYERR